MRRGQDQPKLILQHTDFDLLTDHGQWWAIWIVHLQISPRPKLLILVCKIRAKFLSTGLHDKSWLQQWLMNLMRAEGRVAWANISESVKVNAPERPGFLHQVLSAELLCSRANLNCDRPGPAQNTPARESRQTKLEMESWETHVCSFQLLRIVGTRN